MSAVLTKEYAQEQAALGECEGDCKLHRGTVSAVQVIGHGRVWGWMAYCEKAVETDQRNGYEVKEQA